MTDPLEGPGALARVHRLDPRRRRLDRPERCTIGVITNPNSGKNRRHPGRLDALERSLGRYGIIRRTHDQDDLRAAIEEFYDVGCKYWVCDGGDGSLHWLLSIANELATARETEWPWIVPANGGTVDFVAAKAGVRGQAVQVVRDLVRCIERRETPTVVELDTLRVVGTPDGDAGEPVVRIGFAAAIGGVAQRFFDKLYRYDRIDAWKIIDVVARSTAGGLAASTPASVRRWLVPELQRYAEDVFEPIQAEVVVDRQRLPFERFSTLQVGSIDINLSGVVRTFRHAANDGVLHAQAVGGSAIDVIVNLPNMVMGTPIWGRRVFDGPASELAVTAAPSHNLDPVIDGELFYGLRKLDISRGPKLRIPVVPR